MTDKTDKTDKKKTVENRRKLLKTVAAGSGAIIAGKTLPENWTRPAVDSVILPAHAQTSGGPYSGTLMASLDSGTLLARATDSLVPQAHADNPVSYDVSWCITAVSDTAADVSFLVTKNECGEVSDAELCTALAVPVGVRTDLVCNPACKGGANAGEWLNKLGLVKDALASATAFVTLSGVRPGDTFRFEYLPGTIDESRTLVAGTCGPTSVTCVKVDC